MASVQVITLPYLYCDQGDMERFMSVGGVYSRLDQDGDKVIDFATEQSFIQDCITEATETINFYCYDKYDPSILATSPWVNRKTTLFACYRLCSVRLNPVPDQLMEDAASTEELLEKIRDNGWKLPGVPLRRVLAPVMSLTRVVPWPYTFRCIRVERQNSSQYNRTTLQQNIDYQEAFQVEPR